MDARGRRRDDAHMPLELTDQELATAAQACRAMAHSIRARSAPLAGMRALRYFMFGGKEEVTKIVTVVSIVALFTLTAPLAASAEEPEGAAESAALAWFGLLDAGKSNESWSAASTFVRERMSQRWWRVKIDRGRAGLGPLHWRKLQSAAFAQTIPASLWSGDWAPPKGGLVRRLKSLFLRFRLGDPVAFALSTAFVAKAERDGEWVDLDAAKQAPFGMFGVMTDL